MRLRRLLAGAAGGLAGTAAVNRLLTARAGTLHPGLDGDQRTYRWRGFDIAYTERGDPSDPDVLLLHGIHAAASTREFRGIANRLAEEYHVLAPDLPGFGRSDRPAVAYTTDLYESFVRDFARDQTTDAVCLASSLTGAHAAIAADAADFDRLVLVCPAADTTVERPWLRALVRAPVVGTGLFNLLASKPGIEYFDQRDAYYHPQNVDSATVDYQWRTSHQANARFAPASFLGGYLDPVVDLGSQLAALDAPVTLVWGREAELTTLTEGRRLAEEGDTRLVVVNEARLTPHAEHPDVFLDALSRELPRLEDD
ncbi:alpha/beta fold hydrolase [Salarchaeum japonicum]|uniref:Alpha/beta fold hydrolase n=1 Tax=Salarchaeum japonicum TaxID=555573 RepID=A0AAV3T1W1_9EURY|nr:alpha/beta hydrolase [Salarchaeum japonicum]